MRGKTRFIVIHRRFPQTTQRNALYNKVPTLALRCAFVETGLRKQKFAGNSPKTVDKLTELVWPRDDSSKCWERPESTR